MRRRIDYLEKSLKEGNLENSIRNKNARLNYYALLSLVHSELGANVMRMTRLARSMRKWKMSMGGWKEELETCERKVAYLRTNLFSRNPTVRKVQMVG